MFGWNGMTAIKFLVGNLLPVKDNLAEQPVIFQQDNASIHCAYSTRNWFIDNNLVVSSWPAHSPDLNPIENLWGILTRTGYKDNRQFQTKAELRHAITAAWAGILLGTIRSLIESMAHRTIAVMIAEGGPTKY